MKLAASRPRIVLGIYNINSNKCTHSDSRISREYLAYFSKMELKDIYGLLL